MRKGYTVYKTIKNMKLKRCKGFTTLTVFNTKGNTALGKAIRQAQKEKPEFIVWYEVVSINKEGTAGTVNIIIKRPQMRACFNTCSMWISNMNTSSD